MIYRSEKLTDTETRRQILRNVPIHVEDVLPQGVHEYIMQVEHRPGRSANVGFDADSPEEAFELYPMVGTKALEQIRNPKRKPAIVKATQFPRFSLDGPNGHQ